MFDVAVDQIATIVERTPAATKKIASRARDKVRGRPPCSMATGRVVAAFLTAARCGGLEAILAVLAPNVVRRLEPALVPAGGTAELRGAQAGGRLVLALTFAVENGKIAGYEMIADPGRLRGLDVAVPDWPGA